MLDKLISVLDVGHVWFKQCLNTNEMPELKIQLIGLKNFVKQAFGNEKC
jgi:hypothetical protein